MPQPPWRKVLVLRVPAQPAHAGLWTPALDVVAGPRLLRITILDHDDQSNPIGTDWNIEKDSPCSANGLSDKKSGDTVGDLLAANASRGALIGKVGGSAADLASGNPRTYTGARVFPVGGYAVIKITADEVGPLYFTMNDTLAGFPHHSGNLQLLLEEMDL